MIRSKDPDGVIHYYLVREEDEAVQAFVAKLKERKAPSDAELEAIALVLTDSRGIWDPNHDQDAKCARSGCGHTYERHFDTCADMEPVGCKYCGHYGCPRFVEPPS